MKLYRCKTPTDHLCACGKVHRALLKAGIAVDIERVPLSAKAERRQNIVELTGQPKVPVLVEDDGRVTYDSKRIIERIRGGFEQS
jgi:glutathione S-transferase